MPTYLLACTTGHQRDEKRTVDERDRLSVCPECGQPEVRRYTAPQILFPRSLFTQWYDVHTKSPREMAQDPNIERYRPGDSPNPGHARRQTASPPITNYLPTRDEVNAYVARKADSLKPVEGEVPIPL